jgi:hypothetical protein
MSIVARHSKLVKELSMAAPLMRPAKPEPNECDLALVGVGRHNNLVLAVW